MTQNIQRRTGKVREMLADGEYDLQLRIGELEELEEATGYGAYLTLNRLLTDEFKIKEITETIRLGLIGSGEMSPREATSYIINSLVKPIDLDNRSFVMDYRNAAINALHAALNGVSDEPLIDDEDDEADAGELTPEESPTPPAE